MYSQTPTESCSIVKYTLFRLVDGILKEWKTLSSVFNINSPVTIFFGGGTPSLIETKYIEKIVNKISENMPSLEVSLEGNPGDLVGKVSGLRDAGVTRLSVGVQALDDRELKFLNRDHNVHQAWRSVQESLEVFPQSTSVDIIFGRPNQSVSTLESELYQLIETRVPHVSLYQLTIERGTKLHKQVTKGEVTVPDEDTMADMYQTVVETLAKAGIERYEVSNFSRPGSQCLHNLGYWTGRDYLGLGPGAHSRVTTGSERLALVNIPYPEKWISEVEKVGHGVKTRNKLEVKDSLKELIATGLRTVSGISVHDWDRVSGGLVNMEDLYNNLDADQTGIMMTDDHHLRSKTDSIAILDSVIPYVFNALDEIKF